MGDSIGCVIVIILYGVFTYIFINKVKETFLGFELRKNNRRWIVGNFIFSISYCGFLISYMLNILVAFKIIQSMRLTSENTSFSCFIFIAILLISKYIIESKN